MAKQKSTQSIVAGDGRGAGRKEWSVMDPDMDYPDIDIDPRMLSCPRCGTTGDIVNQNCANGTCSE